MKNPSKVFRRVSAVGWYLVAAFFISVLNQWKGDAHFYALVVILAGAYGLHWVTCWIGKVFFGVGK